MKLSEIFKRTSPREEPSSESRAVAPKEENSAKLPPFKTASERLPAESQTVVFEPPRPALPESFFYPDAKEAAHLHAEFLRELSADHALFGVPLETFAAREGNDDGLFRFRGNPRRYILVHLTHLGKTESDKYHPHVLFDGTFAEFLQREKELYNIESPA